MSITLIGLGPGDPDLMSVKAHKLIPLLDVIFVPEKSGQSSLARQICAPLVASYPDLRDRMVAVPLDMKQDRTKINLAYDKAAAQMLKAHHSGQKVGYLCEGDPMLYGSAIYLLDRLKSHIVVDIVPGISSITACASAAISPLARGRQIVCIMPATLPDKQLGAALMQCDVAVFLKAGRHIERLRKLLKRCKYMDAYGVTQASQDTQTIWSLQDTTNRSSNYFTTLLAIRSGHQWTYPQ